MGKGVILKGKNNENIYPVSASDLIFDPSTKKSVKSELSVKVEEAPKDDKQYARVNGAWAEVEAGAVSETVFISVLPGVAELHGVSVKVTTGEGETLLDTTWQGATLSCQIRSGLQYTVSVGARDGFITPDAVTHTAVKGVSRNVSMTYIESRLTVNILSNQGADSVISGVKATVKYGSTTVQVGNGGTISLPQDVAVTITFPAVEGYKTPDAVTYNHTSGGYVKSGTYQTELVTVNVSADNGASVDGQIVTVMISGGGGGDLPVSIVGVEGVGSGTTTFTVTGGKVQFKVAFGTAYGVSISAMDGFTVPAAQSYTASESSRNLAFVYEKYLYGVFIQGISGKLYTEDEWTNQEIANGVAVITDKCEFVVDMSCYSTSGYADGWAEDNTVLIEGCATASTLEESYNDVNGKQNTEAIVAQVGVGGGSGLCYNTVALIGVRGYLCSSGELKVYIENLKKIEELIKLI